MARDGHKTFDAWISVAALAGGVFIATSAEARYSAVDNFQVYYTGGFCDFDGSDCGSTYKLPYEVSFGGQKTDQMLLRFDGRLLFVDSNLKAITEINTGISDGPRVTMDSTGRRYFPPDSVPSFAFTTTLKQLASVGGAKITAKIGQLPGDIAPDLTVDYTIANKIITASWFTCFSPRACLQDVHSVTLTPNAGGFAVVYGGINSGKAGHQLRALFGDAVPEPSAWALLVLGFGSTGAVLRAHRKRRLRLA